MVTIYKYPLDQGHNTIELPVCAEVLHVHPQNDRLYLWVKLDTEQQIKTHRTYAVLMTGEEINIPIYRYIGTAHIHNGSIVLHVFELKKPKLTSYAN